MRSKKYLWKICEEIYTELYKAADPPLDFHQAVKQGITAKPNWFMNYYLPMRRQQEIFNRIVKKYKCDKRELKAINAEIWLGSSPTGVKK